jgi:hypothetical protein
MAMGCGMDSWSLIPSIARDFSVIQNIQTSSGTQAASSPVGISAIQCQDQLYIHIYFLGMVLS